MSPPSSRLVRAISNSAVLLSAFALGLSACGGQARLTVAQGTGSDPVLPPPQQSLIPVVEVAPALGWAPGAKPTAAPGLKVEVFAADLDHPRWLYVLPNGDVLVAETNAPYRPEDTSGIRGWFVDLMLKRAGAAVPSADRVTLLRDANADGVAELRSAFLEGLRSPFGMALVGDTLYVANTDAVVRFPYTMGATRIAEAGIEVTELPAGLINHHWTKNIIASRDGSLLYATVGSNSNVGEHGMTAERGRAAIWEIEPQSGRHRVFASGLRNPNGLAWEPLTGALWTAVNERDGLGNDLVPDYMTSVKDGGFYGWPYSYFGEHVDERVQYPRPDLVAVAIKPDYALGPHTASIGLTFDESSTLPEPYLGGAFIGQHGSWNRKPRSGYKVIFVPFEGGRPAGPPLDVLTGFLGDDGKAFGRPVGVAFDNRGALLVADDVGNRIWRVSRPRDSECAGTCAS